MKKIEELKSNESDITSNADEHIPGEFEMEYLNYESNIGGKKPKNGKRKVISMMEYLGFFCHKHNIDLKNEIKRNFPMHIYLN